MAMSIVIDARTATDHFPGIGRYVVNLSQAMRQIAPDLPIALISDPLASGTRLALPDLPRVTCSASPFSLRQQWVVPRLLRRMGATLYHSPYYLMPYRPGVPTVLTCYDLIPLLYPRYFGVAQRLMFRVAHSLALTTAAAILSISQITKGDLVRHFGIDPQKIVVTPLAAGERFMPQSSERIAALRRKHVLPEEYALYLGSNKPHKNLVRLVQAWAVGGGDSSCAKLVVGGQWDSRFPEAGKVVEDLGLTDQVAFLGPLDEADLPALYSGAACFVFPSLYEGFGLPVLEAMACRTPVACSNTSSLPEVAADAALLFDPTSVESIADALSRLLADLDLREELRERGLRRAACFTWAETAEQTRNVYQSIASVDTVG